MISEIGIVTNMRAVRTTILALFATTICMSANAEYYRWIDKNGDVQYGDHVPAADTNQGRDRINEGGRVVESIDRAKTAEEIRVWEEQQRLAEIQRQEVAEQEAYDRALVATFTSVEDMENARDERVTLIEQTIELSRGRLHKQQKELAKLNDTRKRFESQNLNTPPWIDRNEKQILDQISGIEDYIRDRELEKEELKQQFDRDIERFSELTTRSITVR